MPASRLVAPRWVCPSTPAVSKGGGTVAAMVGGCGHQLPQSPPAPDVVGIPQTGEPRRARDVTVPAWRCSPGAAVPLARPRPARHGPPVRGAGWSRCFPRLRVRRPRRPHCSPLETWRRPPAPLRRDPRRDRPRSRPLSARRIGDRRVGRVSSGLRTAGGPASARWWRTGPAARLPVPHRATGSPTLARTGGGPAARARAARPRPRAHPAG